VTAGAARSGGDWIALKRREAEKRQESDARRTFLTLQAVEKEVKTTNAVIKQNEELNVRLAEMEAQRARDPCGEMAGFTRLHTTRDAVPDAFGAEMHTVTVKEGHGAYPVVNRPSSVVQFIDGGHLDRIQEE